jgi:hypothetical protein
MQAVPSWGFVMWADVYKGPQQGQTHTYYDLSLKGTTEQVNMWIESRQIQPSSLTPTSFSLTCPQSWAQLRPGPLCGVSSIWLSALVQRPLQIISVTG